MVDGVSEVLNHVAIQLFSVQSIMIHDVSSLKSLILLNDTYNFKTVRFCRTK